MTIPPAKSEANIREPRPHPRPHVGLFGRGGRLPGAWSLSVTVLAIVLIFALRYQWLPNHLNNYKVNGLIVLLALVAFGSQLIWFVGFSAYSRKLRIGVLLGLLAALGGLVACFRVEHVTGDLVPSFAFRWSPRADELLKQPATQVGEVDLATTTPDDFPQFLGPHRNGMLTKPALATNWDRDPPRLIWRQPIGAGWSAFSVVNGHAVTMEQRGENELVTCYDVTTGKLQWSHAVAARHKTIPGGIGPRSTPTIHEGNVYALGATGVLRCLDGSNGQEIWRDDLLARIGITADKDLAAIAWGRSASPLVFDDLVVVPLGGPKGGPLISLIAYNRDTGEIVWTGGHRQAAYSSARLVTFCGIPQIVCTMEDWIVSHDPQTGMVLWEYPWPGSSSGDANVSQVIPATEDIAFVSKGYGGGALTVQLSNKQPGQWQVTELRKKSTLLRTKFSNVVVFAGCIYGLSDGILECVEVKTVQRRWKAGRYGQGQVLLVGDLLLIQAENGDVALVQASPERYEEICRFPALEGITWNNPCLFGRYLLVRNSQQAACYELPLSDRPG